MAEVVEEKVSVIEHCEQALNKPSTSFVLPSDIREMERELRDSASGQAHLEAQIQNLKEASEVARGQGFKQ